MNRSCLPQVYFGVGLSLFAVATVEATNNGRTKSPGNPGSYGVQLLVAPADEKGELNSDDTLKRHIGVSLFRGNRSVSDADVRIVCEPLSARAGRVVEIPVETIEVTREAAGLTHFGNTVELAPGTYHIAVMVDDRARADFTVDV